MHPVIFLWAHPRSMSTAIERIMRLKLVELYAEQLDDEQAAEAQIRLLLSQPSKSFEGG